MEKTKAQLTFAEGDYERAIRIQNEDPGAISERLVDQKRELRNQLRAQAESQLAEVDGAKDELDYTYLRSPFDGIIVATYVQNFEHVQAKQSIMRILDTTRVEMVVDIPENLISLIPYVTEISVTLDPFPDREISAKVKEIGTEASTTTRTFPVTLVMDQPSDIQVLAGMAGEARLVKATYPDLATRGMEIPLNALFSMDEDKKDYVWIIDEATMQVSQREVQLGRMTNTGVVIYQGIQPGEWIVTAGVHFLREGQQVDFISEDIEAIE